MNIIRNNIWINNIFINSFLRFYYNITYKRFNNNIRYIMYIINLII